MRRLKVLVMDDNETNRKAAHSLLSDHDVTTVENIDAAVMVLNGTTFDVVLTDLLVPPFARGHMWEKFAGQEVAMGSTLALYALTKGVKYVGIVTDANHHDHPAAAALDYPAGSGLCQIGNSRLVCINDAAVYLKEDTFEFVGGFEEAFVYPQITDSAGEKVIGFQGLVKSKPWHQVLEMLVLG